MSSGRAPKRTAVANIKPDAEVDAGHGQGRLDEVTNADKPLAARAMEVNAIRVATDQHNFLRGGMT